jgi:hypothetical protein
VAHAGTQPRKIQPVNASPAWHDARVRRAALIAIALRATGAHAHVGPAIDDNNRYLKLTAQGDRVRLAYTVFFGELPGSILRRTIDADHDGAISEAESAAFAGSLARAIAAALTVTVDGAPAPIAWRQVVVGLGTPDAAAGTFSIDLVASWCLAPPRGRHTVALRDRYPLAQPGETEVVIEDSPGVVLDRARLGGAADAAHDWKLAGEAAPLADPGLEVALTAGEAAIVAPDAACPATPARAIPASAVVAAGALLGAGLAGLVTWRRRRARRG